MDKTNVRCGSAKPTVTKLLAFLLVVCLIECAAEERINSRGSKLSKVIAKVNGWRSQRGGSCLSYGHSCWGAHGKRSGKPLATAPDWYVTRMLRRMTSNTDTSGARQQAVKNNDINAIYQAENDASSNQLIDNEETPVDFVPRNGEAIPMLDDDLVSKFNIWQMMRQASEEK